MDYEEARSCWPGVTPSSKLQKGVRADCHQRRIDKAHKRHLTAIRALAQVCKRGPAVQINIAEKQINTAG